MKSFICVLAVCAAVVACNANQNDDGLQSIRADSLLECFDYMPDSYCVGDDVSMMYDTETVIYDDGICYFPTREKVCDFFCNEEIRMCDCPQELFDQFTDMLSDYQQGLVTREEYEILWYNYVTEYTQCMEAMPYARAD